VLNTHDMYDSLGKQLVWADNWILYIMSPWILQTHGPNLANAPSQLVYGTVFIQQSATLIGLVIQRLDEL